MLSKEEIFETAERMLGRGAPISRDGIGFNKFDFDKMETLLDEIGEGKKMKDGQATAILRVLRRYKNTQLQSLADGIEETLTDLQQKEKEKEKEKEKPRVDILRYIADGILLFWEFSREAQRILKEEFSKEDGFWKKNEEDDRWEYCLFFDSAKKFAEKMKGVLDTSVLEKELENLSQHRNIKKQVLAIRDPASIDSLWIKSDYDRGLIDLCKKHGGKWVPREKAWEISFSEVVPVFRGLDEERFDKESLRPWAETFSGWTHTPTLLDVGGIKSLKWKPYEFQIEDAKKLLSLKTGLNGNEVGCGKTFEQVIIGESIGLPKLVICPATLRVNWMKEIHMVNPDADVSILYSDKEFRVGKDWTIVGYPSLEKFQKELEAEMFQVVMMDEAHYIQAVANSGNPDSKRARVALRLAATSEFVYPITGTPKTNRNKNIYNVLRAIRHPLTRGKKAFFEYAKTFCDAQRNSFGWNFDGNSNDEELNKELKPVMVRHLKKEVLPNLVKMRQAIPLRIDLSEYHRFIDEYRKESNNAIAMTYLAKAKQSVAIQKIAQTKEFAKQMVDQGEKVVIVTCFTEVVKQLCEEFKCPKIVGGMSDKEKNKAIEDFQQKDDVKVIVLNVVAGGVGVTLTAAHNMVVNDIPWTTGELEQAEGRIWRSGQTEVAMIFYMVAEGCKMDDLLQEVVSKKSVTINTAIDGGLGDEIDFREMLVR